jgi:hypothetical protein
MNRFRTLQHITSPGSPGVPNEDGAGARGRYAWIIDGATGVAGVSLTSAPSDAAWLAGCLAERLEASAPSGIGMEALQRDIGAAFAAVTADHGSAGGEPTEDHVAPSACLGLLEIDGDCRLRGRFLGDVVALVPARDGEVVRWSDERARPFELLTLASLGSRGGGGIPEETRAQILKNRASMNQPGGYWVVHPRRAWAGRELAFEARIAAGRPLVLATDGFMRLVDVFGAYTDATLYDAMAAGGTTELLGELRRLETEEGGSPARPRVKVHDDATAIVVVGEIGP